MPYRKGMGKEHLRWSLRRLVCLAVLETGGNWDVWDVGVGGLPPCFFLYFVHSEGCPMQNSRHLWLAEIADASHKKRFHGMILEFCNSTQVFYITGVELKMVRIAL